MERLGVDAGAVRIIIYNLLDETAALVPRRLGEDCGLNSREDETASQQLVLADLLACAGHI